MGLSTGAKPMAIETLRLHKSFNGVKAVDDLDLAVPAGSVYGFLGPNGAGKTTTIKMLTGLSRPDGGQIRICGKEVRFASITHRKDIGFLPDVPSFYDWMNAEEFLAFSGRLFGLDSKGLKTRISELLRMVDLAEVKKRIGSYSRGMKQRLGIAQAMIHEPGVLLLDEPTSALDPIGRKEVLQIVASLAGKTTVFFSSHILADVERVCDRVVILHKGKKLIEGTMPDLKRLAGSRSIQLELETSERKAEFVRYLSTLDWVEQVQERGEEILLGVRNLGKAEYEVPAIMSQMKLGLRKFVLLETSLEDIFLNAVKES
jgi:ABC-2 type transport system ATP-binding protein